MKIGLFNRIVNFGIRIWAGVMAVARFPAFFKGKEPFKRNREQEAVLRTNFLGGYYPVPHGPGTKFYGRLLKPLEKDGKPVKVSLERMTIDSQVPFREEEQGYEGNIGFQVIYSVPYETGALETYGRYLGADKERVREPLNRIVLQAIEEVEKPGDTGAIQEKAAKIFKSEAKNYKKNYGIDIHGVSIMAPQFDEESQQIIMNKAKALAEKEERQIMAEGVEGALDGFYEAVAGVYRRKGLEPEPGEILAKTLEMYKLERYHSMTQNPGATVIMSGSDLGNRIIPIRGKTSESGEQGEKSN